MAGIFPEGRDGALPCNEVTPNGYCPQVMPNTPPLYYGDGCDVRLRPEVLNALISEMAATVDQAGLAYDATSRENVERAIRYLIQRGQTKGAIAAGGPNNYTVALDPPLTGYNDYLFINVIPELTNQGAVRINVDGRGLVRVLRNDGEELKFDDFRAGIPVMLTYYQGAFFMPYLSRSQVPVVLNGNISAWIRTDGNDATGDGTENSPEKAFRTIAGAWQAVGTRYAASPLFGIDLRFGIPGSYEGTGFQGYGGRVTVQGDVNNPDAYRITTVPSSIADKASIGTAGMNRLEFYGVSIVATDPSPGNIPLRIGDGTNIYMISSNVYTEHSGIQALVAANRGALSFHPGPRPCRFGSDKGNFRIGTGFNFNDVSSIMGGRDPVTVTQCEATPMTYDTSFLFLKGLSSAAFFQMDFADLGVVGRKYIVSQNSTLNLHGEAVPGSQAGQTSSGGVVE